MPRENFSPIASIYRNAISGVRLRKNRGVKRGIHKVRMHKFPIFRTPYVRFCSTTPPGLRMYSKIRDEFKIKHTKKTLFVIFPRHNFSEWASEEFAETFHQWHIWVHVKYFIYFTVLRYSKIVRRIQLYND